MLFLPVDYQTVIYKSAHLQVRLDSHFMQKWPKSDLSPPKDSYLIFFTEV